MEGTYQHLLAMGTYSYTFNSVIFCKNQNPKIIRMITEIIARRSENDTFEIEILESVKSQSTRLSKQPH